VYVCVCEGRKGGVHVYLEGEGGVCVCMYVCVNVNGFMYICVRGDSVPIMIVSAGVQNR
jgi:hypothetical protein